MLKAGYLEDWEYHTLSGSPARGQRHAANAMDNFCFDVTLSYRRLERPRRVPAEL